MDVNNPLLQSLDLVPYADIRFEHLEPATSQIVADNRIALEAIIVSQSQQPTWDGLVLAMDTLNARLDDVFGVLITCSQLPQAPEWEAASDECFGQVIAWKNEILQSLPLFEAYQALASSEDAEQFSAVQKTLLDKKLNAFRASGLDLSSDKVESLSALNDQIAAHEEAFNNNVRQANSAWDKLITEESRLAGLSDSLKSKLALKASATDREGWLLTLDEEAIYNDVMSHCEDREIRKELWTAYSTRASDVGPAAGENDNGPELAKLLELRHEKAVLLGCENYAELSLRTKMATSTEQVLDFLRSRIAHEKPLIDAQAQSILDLAESLSYTDLGAWDYPYLVNKIGAQLSSIPDAELQAYFPFTKMMERLVVTVERLFGVQLVAQQSFSTWHPDVQLFELLDGEELLGHIYVDPYFRAPKSDGCWTQAVRNRRVDADGNVTLPVAIFHGNFSPSEENQPSLLSHLQLSMLVHEFGHCLQQVLTRSPYGELSDIRALSLDAGEFAGKMLEEWCWSPESLRWISSHYQTDQQLSVEQVNQLLEARKATMPLKAGDELVRALFDFELHRTYGEGRSVQDVLVQARAQVQTLAWPEDDRFANAFDYLTTGYDAGYYVYEWSGAIARQVFARFEQDGVFNLATGMAFREAFYTPGGERPLLESFEIFMGEPATGF